MSGRRRLRATVLGPLPLSVQFEPASLDGFPAPRRGELVVPLAATPADLAAGRRRYEIVVEGWRFEVDVEDAGRAALREKAARAAAGADGPTATTLRAQIPGRVVRVWVRDGDAVEQGQRLLAIDAMKMENEIRSPHAGLVNGLRVAVDDKVERGDVLLSIG